MTSDVLDRLDRIERRLEALEHAVTPAAAPPVGRPAPAPVPARPVVAPPPRPARPTPPPKPKREIDWATVFGAKGLAVAGGVVTVLGIVFFFALAVNRGWIGPGSRVALGAAASTIVFVAGLELRRRYGRLHAPVAAVGAGLAGGYATLLAATALYDLVPEGAGLIFAAVIAAAGIAVSLVWREQLLAAIGLLGAIVAPALLALDSSLTPVGTAFVAFMVAAAAAVSVSLRWRGLLIAAAIAGTPQALLLFADRARPDSELVVLAAAFCGIYLAAGIGRQLRSVSARIDATASTFVVGSAGLVLLFALELFSESDRVHRGIDLLAFAAAYAAVGTFLYARKGGRDLGSIVIALALALGAVAAADLLSGGSLTYAWAAEAAALVWIARRLREPRFALGALAYLLLALAHALAVDAPPRQLFEAGEHPAAGAASLVAVALASGAVASWAVEWTKLPLWAAFAGNRRAVRVAASALAAVLLADAAALAVLELYVRVWPDGGAAGFDHGHVAVTGLWALAGVVAVALGLPRRSSAVAAAGLVWCGAVLAKTTLYDARSLSAALYSYAFLEVAGALLLAAVLVQARRRRLWPDPTVAYGTVAVSLLLTLDAASTLLDGRLEGAAYLAVAALYGCLATLFLERGDRAFATLLWSLGRDRRGRRGGSACPRPVARRRLVGERRRVRRARGRRIRATFPARRGVLPSPCIRALVRRGGDPGRPPLGEPAPGPRGSRPYRADARDLPRRPSLPPAADPGQRRPRRRPRRAAAEAPDDRRVARRRADRLRPVSVHPRARRMDRPARRHDKLPERPHRRERALGRARAHAALRRAPPEQRGATRRRAGAVRRQPRKALRLRPLTPQLDHAGAVVSRRRSGPAPGRILLSASRRAPRKRVCRVRVTRSPPPPLSYRHPKEALLSILWIILIIIVVLALLGFFSRGVW